VVDDVSSDEHGADMRDYMDIIDLAVEKSWCGLLIVRGSGASSLKTES